MTAAQNGLGAVGENADQRAIPEATVARLAIYLRVLTTLHERGISTVSSEELAAESGVNSAKLRKDLSFLGSYGVRGVGYDVALLTETVQHTLGLHQNRAVALIGIGHLGRALLGYAGFASRGFRISALIDADPELVGSTIGGLKVAHVDELDTIVAREHIAIAVLAVPASAAQTVCDRLVLAGVTSILNFAPAVVSVPNHVHVRKVDLAAELQILSFHDTRRSAPAEATAAAVPEDARSLVEEARA